MVRVEVYILKGGLGHVWAIRGLSRMGMFLIVIKTYISHDLATRCNIVATLVRLQASCRQ